MSAKRLVFEWWLLLLCSFALASYSVATGLNSKLDSRILDFATSLVAKPPADDVLVIAIDEQSLEQVGAWPWSRDLHAELIDRIDAAGPEQIIYDVLFVEPTNSAADGELAKAMAGSGKVVLPHSFIRIGNSEDGVVAELPLPELTAAAQAIGHVSATQDADGTLRRFSCRERTAGETYPHMIIAALQAQVAGEMAENCIGRPVVPFQDPGAVTTISASDVLQGALGDEFVRGRTVFVGATALGMGDRYIVPSGAWESMPGVQTQASFFLAARDGSLITPAGKYWSGGLAWLAIALLFGAFWLLDPKRGLLATIGIIAGTFLVAVMLVLVARVWVGPAATLITLLLAYPLWNWRRLSAVSAYLDREAARLLTTSGETPAGTGFDVVARQVDRMRSLVTNVSDSFAFMRRVIELAPDAMMVFDRLGALQMMNERSAALFPGWEVEGDHPTLEEMLMLINASFDGDKGELSVGANQTYLVARAKFRLSDEEETGEIVVLRDISQIRRRENERQQMLEFLSHDMRSPQVAIIGLADRGKERATEQERFKRIRAQAERTLKLADDFVQIARLEEAHLQYEDTDLAALVEEACDRFYSLARKAKIEIRQELPEMPIFAWVDASIIARLLENLLGNAIKFAPGGSSVTVSLTQTEDGNFELVVADQGPGLPMERLADPFARFGAHETKAGPSAGLGLTFVKRAVELHQGTIIVRSAPGKGTRFTINLPDASGGAGA